MTATTTEHRIVCDECGQIMGLFHKDCAGKWVREQRTVTDWTRTPTTARPTGYVDIDHWLTHDGGPELDGPVLLTDEPSGDAMRWTGGDHA